MRLRSSSRGRPKSCLPVGRMAMIHATSSSGRCSCRSCPIRRFSSKHFPVMRLGCCSPKRNRLAAGSTWRSPISPTNTVSESSDSWCGQSRPSSRRSARSAESARQSQFASPIEETAIVRRGDAPSVSPQKFGAGAKFRGTWCAHAAVANAAI